MYDYSNVDYNSVFPYLRVIIRPIHGDEVVLEWGIELGRWDSGPTWPLLSRHVLHASLSTFMAHPSINSLHKCLGKIESKAEAKLEFMEGFGGLSHGVKHAFRSGKTRGFDWRKAQLRAILRLLAENENRIFEALRQDLGKHPVEAYRDEVSYFRFESFFFLSCLNLVDEVCYSVWSLKRWVCYFGFESLFFFFFFFSVWNCW